MCIFEEYVWVLFLSCFLLSVLTGCHNVTRYTENEDIMAFTFNTGLRIGATWSWDEVSGVIIQNQFFWPFFSPYTLVRKYDGFIYVLMITVLILFTHRMAEMVRLEEWNLDSLYSHPFVHFKNHVNLGLKFSQFLFVTNFLFKYGLVALSQG